MKEEKIMVSKENTEEEGEGAEKRKEGEEQEDQTGGEKKER